MRGAIAYTGALIKGDEAARFRHEMMLTYAAGYAAARGLRWRRPLYADADKFDVRRAKCEV
jgi:hypothetical protein